MILTLLLGALSLISAKNIGLPTHTAANPNGYWLDLPQDRSYIFCGDRIFFSKSFDQKVKLEYENQDRVASFRQHCQHRKNHIEQQAKAAGIEGTSLILTSFEHLNEKLKQVAKNKKHQNYLDKKGYHYKELVKVFGVVELNRLRTSNLLLPYLSKEEFDHIYSSSTNNPDYLKAEYSRYSSNLLTQSPAMLYTADGKIYYFSFNLSDEQLRRLGATVGAKGGGGGSGGSGGGASGSAGNSTAGNKKGSDAENPKDLATQEGTRMPASENASAGTEAGFPGFATESSALRVVPQPTRLPSSMGIPPSRTLNVPSRRQISQSVSRSSTSNNRSSASAMPNLNALAQNVNQGLGGLGSSRSSGSSSDSSSSSTQRQPASTTALSTSTPSKPASASPATTAPTRPALEEIKVQREKISPNLPAAQFIPKSQPTKVIVEQGQKSDRIAGVQPTSGNTMANQNLILTGLRVVDKKNKCSLEGWSNIVNRRLNFYDTKQDSEDKNICIPSDPQYCGASHYREDCLDAKANQSCSDVVDEDIENICKKYFSYEKTSRSIASQISQKDAKLSYEQRLRCAEVMMAITCKQNPCEITRDESEPKVVFYSEARNLRIKKDMESELDRMACKNNNEEMDLDSDGATCEKIKEITYSFINLELLASMDTQSITNLKHELVSPRAGIYKVAETTKPLDKILRLPHVNFITSANSTSPLQFLKSGEYIDIKKELKDSPWQPQNIEAYEEDILKLRLYYDLNNEQNLCDYYEKNRGSATRGER